VTNPLGHLYGYRLPGVPERFLGRLAAGTRRKKSEKKGSMLPDAAATAVGLTFGEHPAGVLAGLAVVGLLGAAGAVWALARRGRGAR
jgi:hypothetical protein